MGFRWQFRNVVATYWQPGAFYGLLLVIFGSLLWFHLGTLVGGYSARELATLQDSTSLRHIFEHPVNAPFTLLARGLLYLQDQSLLLVRAAATIFGLVTLTTFYWLIRHWHGERSAVLGTIIFGCSAWFLHTARLGTPEILLFMILTLVACGVWLKRTSSPLVLLLSFLLAATVLYIPGMIWFVLVGVLWQWKTIDRLFKEHLATVTLGALLMLAILAPLGLAIYKSPLLAKVIAGLPAEGWPMPLEVLNRLAHVPFNLFLGGPQDPEHWLGRLPVLAVFSTVMFILGAFVYIRHWHLRRSKLVGGVLVIGTLLISLGGAVTLSVVIPVVYMVVATGIGLLLDRWYRVFPRNTIAQGVGLGLVTLAVAATCLFNLRRYFIAWPASPPTKQVFVIKQTP